jgi:hypothetical protein
MMQRGIRQGCPIVLFVVETLGISIRNSPSIQVFQKEGMENDIS